MFPPDEIANQLMGTELDFCVQEIYVLVKDTSHVVKVEDVNQLNEMLTPSNHIFNPLPISSVLSLPNISYGRV